MDKKYYYKVEIEIDEEKVIADHKYSLEKMYNAIKKIFLEGRNGILEISNNKTLTFIDIDKNNGIGALGFAALILYDKEWAKPYLRKILWYENDEEDGIEYCEDFLAKSKASEIKGA